MRSWPCDESWLIPTFLVKRRLAMRVPDAARRSVVFIGYKNGETFIPKATGFLVHTLERTEFQFCYLVTAEHVVSSLLTAGHEIFCRLNARDGTTRTHPLPASKWWYHPNGDGSVDVAIIPFEVPRDSVDHDYVPLFADSPSTFKPSYGLGDEIFMVGLFRSHHGRGRNVPIVRTGNIAAMRDEPILTGDRGFMDAYLIEMRSIAGLSGSPVFVNVQPLSVDPRDHPKSMTDFKIVVEPTVGYAFPEFHQPKIRIEPKSPRRSRDPEELDWMRYRFLGLIHGHFDVPNMSEDIVVDDETGRGINVGIGIVVPNDKVIETLYQSDLVNERTEIDRRLVSSAPKVADTDPLTQQLRARHLRFANSLPLN